MYPRAFLAFATVFVCSVALIVSCHAAPPEANMVRFSQAQYWCGEWATGPRIPLLADADGDGYADCIALYHAGETIVDIARTSPLGKTQKNLQARRDFGRDGLAACAARFTGGAGADVMAIFPDGAVRVASGMRLGETTYRTSETVARIPPEQLPLSLRLVAADFTGDGQPDALIVGGDGHLLLLVNMGKGRFTPRPVSGALPSDCKEIAAGLVGEGKAARLFWIAPDNRLMRAALRLGADNSCSISPAFPITKAEPGAKLAVGRFRGGLGTDVLLGRTLFLDGDPKRAVVMTGLPTVAEMQSDDCWLVGDIDNNGRDDLLRRRNTPDRFTGHDVLIHYASFPTDAKKGFISTSQDGLLDDWKTGAIKPGDLDLAALGCRVGHKDVIVEVGSFEDVDQNYLRQEMQKAVASFATLPVKNPDGTLGIALHVLIQPPIPLSRRDGLYPTFDENYPSPTHRGITHYFFADKKGPLVAMLPGDNGHFDGSVKQFFHEFGHNFGLTHDGFHGGPAFCPLYPSLMSYSYTGVLYSVDTERYSDGRLSSVTLDEAHLSEVLPFPMRELEFMNHSPYFFPMKQGARLNETLVDWNRNGIFGEKDVAADINYRPRSNLPRGEAIGTSQTAPTLVTHKTLGGAQRLWLLTGQGKQRLDRAHPGALVLKEWQGTNSESERAKWSAPQIIEAGGVTGEASAWDGGDGTTWIAYPTTSGVCVRALTSSDNGDGPARIMPAVLVPGSTLALPTLASTDGKWWLLLWRGAETRIKACSLRPTTTAQGVVSATVRPEFSLPLFSAGPVGATQSADGLLFSGIECQTAEKNGCMTQYRYAPSADDTLVVKEQIWCGGKKGRGYAPRRSVVLWEPCAGLESGRAYFLAARSGGSPMEATPHYLAMTIAQTDDFGEDLSGGFLTRQLHDEVPSAYAPGACFFGSDLVLAQTLKNETVLVTWGGRGIEPGTMGDFNDIKELSEVGLRRSIFYLTR